MIRFLKDNGLSLAFWLLLFVCITGQAVLGHFVALEGMTASGPSHDLVDFIGGADFLKGVFGNWQAALLQLFALVVFAVFLRQRGASHSRKPEDEERSGVGKALRHPLRHGRSFLYCNSLSLALFASFAAAFVAFFFADLSVDAAERLKAGKPALTTPEFLVSARFWFDVLQTWEAEFFAMGAFLIMTIFLRQENSAESKPIWARDDETGDTNE